MEAFETRLQKRLAGLGLLCGCLAMVLHCLIMVRGDSSLWNTRMLVDPILTVLSVTFAGCALLLPKNRAAGLHLALALAMAAWITFIRYAHVHFFGYEVLGPGLMLSRYLLLFPLAACCRDDKKQLALKVSGLLTLGAVLWVDGLTVLLLLDRVPAALARDVIWAGARLSVLWHPNTAATMYFMGYALCIAFCFLTGRKWLRAVLLALAAVQGGFIAMTHGRITMLAAVAYGAGVLLFAVWKQRGKKLWQGVLVLLVLAAVLLASMEGLYKWNNHRLTEQYLSGQREMSESLFVDENGNIQLTGADQKSLGENMKNLNYRTTIWKYVREGVKDWKLLLFGTELVAQVLHGIPHAHNSYLEILLRWGLPAMLAAVAITVEVLICGIYVVFTSRDGWKISLALMSLAWLPVAMMEKYPFCDNTLGGLFLLGAGYLLCWALEEGKARKTSSSRG